MSFHPEEHVSVPKHVPEEPPPEALPTEERPPEETPREETPREETPPEETPPAETPAAGSSGDTHVIPTEAIKGMSTQLAARADMVQGIGENIDPQLGPKAMGELGEPFSGTVTETVNQAKSVTLETAQNLRHAQAATDDTAAGYEHTNETVRQTAANLENELGSSKTTLNDPAATTPSSTNADTPAVTPPPAPKRGSNVPGNPPDPGRPKIPESEYQQGDNTTPTGWTDKLPPSPTVGKKPPVDTTRAQKLEKIDLNSDRVELTPDGRIAKIDGMPVDEWVHQRALQRGQEVRNMVNDTKNMNADDARKVSKGSIGRMHAVGIDRTTGQVWEGINGSGPTSVIPKPNWLLRIRDRFLGNEGQTPMYSPGANRGDPSVPNLDADGNQRTSAWRQNDPPLRHAEVKVLNEMLEEHWPTDPRTGEPIGPSFDPSDPAAVRQLDDLFAIETVQPVEKGPVWAAPYCANCNVMMGGVFNLAGRFSESPLHPDAEILNRRLPDIDN